MFEFCQPELFSPYPELHYRDLLSRVLWHPIVRAHEERDVFEPWFTQAMRDRDWSDAFELLCIHSATQDDFLRRFKRLDEACPAPCEDARIEAMRHALCTLPSSVWSPHPLAHRKIIRQLKKNQPLLEVTLLHDRLACRYTLGMVVDADFAHVRARAMSALRREFPTGTLISEGEEVERIVLPGGRTLSEMRWELVEDWRPRLVCRNCGHVPQRRDHVEGTPCQRGTGCLGHYMGCFVTPGRWMTFIHRTKPRAAFMRQSVDGIECWEQGEPVRLLPHASTFFESQDWVPCGPALRPTPEQEWRRQQGLMGRDHAKVMRGSR